MIRLSELSVAAAGSGPERWDQRSLDVNSVIQSARTLRAEYIADHLHRAGRVFGRWSGLSDLFAALRRRRQCRRTLSALTALDDRVLADIGVDRAEIAATAVLSCDKPLASGPSLWHGLAAWARREARRRQTLRELSAMSDEMLADIGLSRGDIPAVVAALFAEQAQARSSRETSEASGEASPETPVTAPIPAEVLAFIEVRRGSRQAANQNLDRPAA